MTQFTVVDRRELGTQVRRTREQGYAWIDRELDDSICGVAVPIRDAEGGLAAAINVSLPAGLYTETAACERYLMPLRQAAARIRSAVV
jgi:IclR family pca regulon transcriptional regulator